MRRECLDHVDHPQRAAFAAHSWLIPRLLSRFKDPLVARQGHPGWTTRSAGRVRNGRFLAQGRRSASSLRTPRGLTTPARIRSIPLCGNVAAAGIRMPLHRFAGTIRRNKHRDDRAHGRLQNPLAQNDVRAGEPSRRWEARWNKWKGQPFQSGGLEPGPSHQCDPSRIGVHRLTVTACPGLGSPRVVAPLRLERNPRSDPAGERLRPDAPGRPAPRNRRMLPADGCRRTPMVRSSGQDAPAFVECDQ